MLNYRLSILTSNTIPELAYKLNFWPANSMKAVEERHPRLSFLPRRAVTTNGILIPWSQLLIHNRPSGGLLWTSANMPTSAHT